MQKSFFKYSLTTTLVIILCLFSACKSVKAPYMISNFQDIQELETQDHLFCTSLNLDSAKGDLLKNQLYWRCRLSLAKYKLRSNSSSKKDKKFNFQIRDLVSKISLDLSELQESEFTREIKKMGNHQHKQCLRMGFESDTLDQSKIDDYFLCRKRLIDDQELDPPFGNIDYLNYPNRSYNVSFVIDRRLAKEKENLKKAAKKYPTCVKYNLRKDNFRICSKAQDASRQCFTKINRKKLTREAAEKTVCQRQSYIEFPNTYLNEEDANFYNKEIRTNADVYNQNNFSSLGINSESIKKFRSIRKKKKEAEQKKIEKNINSKLGLYSKIDLTRLRQRYIYACHKEADIVIDKYVDGLKKDCDALKIFVELDE